MFVHDIIKMRYVYDGYLPNYPYHMISDKEMIEAFMNGETGFFYDNFPNVNDGDFITSIAYRQLELAIVYHIAMFLVSTDEPYVIPDWVYSYMLGSTISVNSEYLDIHDLCVQLGVSGIVDEFSAACSKACFNVSKSWVGTDSIYLEDDKKEAIEDIFKQYHVYDMYEMNGSRVYVRPPTVFGEPHVLKSLRLRQSV